MDQFNETTGREKGIRVESASQGSVSDLETNVMDAAQGKVGAAAMPNIFSALLTPPMCWTRWACWWT